MLARAWRFLADGGDLGLASPGETDDARRAFLDGAFAKMHETYGAPAGIDLERSRQAFDFGVALHGAEQALRD